MYPMEELLPIVAKLADKYTSRESSSVPYETARMLMEAVIYCVEEAQKEENRLTAREAVSPDLKYSTGRELIVKKTSLAKMLYNQIIEDFEDYGCCNYKDTILLGMPQFFIRYDAVYNPQNHLLMLDYPLLQEITGEKGIDLIYDYLHCIQLEKQFLGSFDSEVIRRLLNRVHPDYTNLYLDNICQPVLLQAAGCVLTEQPLRELQITKEACRNIRTIFEGNSAGEISEKAIGIIKYLITGLLGEKAAPYFARYSREFGVRVREAISNDSLEALFAAEDSDKTVF